MYSIQQQAYGGNTPLPLQSQHIITTLRKQLSVCILQYLILTTNTITLAGTAYPITPALQIDFIATNDLTQVQQN